MYDSTKIKIKIKCLIKYSAMCISHCFIIFRI